MFTWMRRKEKDSRTYRIFLHPVKYTYNAELEVYEPHTFLLKYGFPITHSIQHFATNRQKKATLVFSVTKFQHARHVWLEAPCQRACSDSQSWSGTACSWSRLCGRAASWSASSPSQKLCRGISDRRRRRHAAGRGRSPSRWRRGRGRSACSTPPRPPPQTPLKIILWRWPKSFEETWSLSVRGLLQVLQVKQEEWKWRPFSTTSSAEKTHPLHLKVRLNLVKSESVGPSTQMNLLKIILMASQCHL